jgi:FlaA1/EpsC-like NDP-sugar epimerase
MFSRQLLLIMLDIFLVNIAAYLPLYFRYEFSIEKIKVEYLEYVTRYTAVQTILMLVIFSLCHLYSSLWKYAGIDEMTNIVYSCSLGTILHFIGMRLLKMNMPRSYYPLELIFLTMLIGASRFAYRVLRSFGNGTGGDSKKKIMVIGAGEAANIIIKEIHNSQYLEGTVVCVIDDDREKLNHYIQGIKIVGNRHYIVAAAEKYKVTDIIIAIPTLSRKEQKQIIEYCKETECRLKILPGMYQLINEEVSVSRLRNVEIEDLLGREPIKLNTEKVMGYVTGKTVLVTGGGGSIGSELCRQIAKYHPKRLIIVDIYENNAYDIEQELKMEEKELDLVVLIASIRNEKRLQSIFEEYHPELVYHAAAHKHVPLMETSPNEAKHA